jgi:hypothetical protein
MYIEVPENRSIQDFALAVNAKKLPVPLFGLTLAEEQICVGYGQLIDWIEFGQTAGFETAFRLPHWKTLVNAAYRYNDTFVILDLQNDEFVINEFEDAEKLLKAYWDFVGWK